MPFLLSFDRRYVLCCAFLLISLGCIAQQTIISGKVIDAETSQPISFVSITFFNTHIGTSTDSLGRFTLSATGSFSRITISAVGYITSIRKIIPGTQNEINIKLEKYQTALREVAIKARSNKPYRNKDNPAVELIRRVIARLY
jgi:hypothetical protein